MLSLPRDPGYWRLGTAKQRTGTVNLAALENLVDGIVQRFENACNVLGGNRRVLGSWCVKREVRALFSVAQVPPQTAETVDYKSPFPVLSCLSPFLYRQTLANLDASFLYVSPVFWIVSCCFRTKFGMQRTPQRRRNIDGGPCNSGWSLGVG